MSEKSKKENPEKKKEEEEEKEESLGSKILGGIGIALGIAAAGIGGKIVYDLYKKNKESKLKGSTVLNYEGAEQQDQIILKLKKQKELKPKIINDEIDKNYVRANSIKDNDEKEEKNKMKLFICPINQKVMEDPVITPYGTTYEREAITKWIEKNKNDYQTKKKLTVDMLVPNYILKSEINYYNESLKL